MRFSQRIKMFIYASVVGLSSLAAPLAAHADDWGCTVILCLADPRGPTTEPQCRPPIERLWRELARGRGFPTCDMGAGSTSNAQHQWASADNCPPQYLQYESESGQARCGFSGAVTVNISGQPYTRVWWSAGDSVTENMSSKAAQSPGASQRFQKDYAVWKAEQDRIAAQQATN